MLRVPGVQQVALRVKIAELNRTAARGFGVERRRRTSTSATASNGSKLFLASLLNTATAAARRCHRQRSSGDDLSIGIRYLQQHGVIRLLSASRRSSRLSGKPATFVAGGEFAVPTIVGSVGLNAVTTDFRAFGAIISFLPTVVDKDRIRLQVAPEFSQINSGLTVGGTPGLQRPRRPRRPSRCAKGRRWPSPACSEDNIQGRPASATCRSWPRSSAAATPPATRPS